VRTALRSRPAAGQARAEPPRHTDRVAIGEGEFLRGRRRNPPAGGVRGGGTSRKRLRRKNSNHQKRDSELPGYFGRINVSQQSAAPDHQVGCAGSSSRLRRISMKALAGAARAMPHIEAPAGQAATVVAMVLGQLQAKLNGLMARLLASSTEVAC